MRVVVTGGAGFIGSNLVQVLLDRGDEVVVLDDLVTGYRENVPEAATFVEGSVADHGAVRAAIKGAQLVFHQAAHRAVARSVEQPLDTDTANVHGTLTVLNAAKDAGVRRVVYASSSSIYGGAAEMPTPESAPLLPRSPYAVTKLAGEHYCRVFAELFGIETVALRYFNVFGPRQRPDSPYAAVIPLFIQAVAAGEAPVVHGDGLQSRDFTFIDDVVRANLAAAIAPADRCSGKAYNVAAGRTFSLLDLLAELSNIFDIGVAPVHVEPRPGDVRYSQADARAAAADLAWRAEIALNEGLRRTAEWFGGVGRDGAHHG